MQCSGCGYSHSEVVETRHDQKDNAIKRRRQCLRCGLRFTTLENLKPYKRKQESDQKDMPAK